LLFVQYVVFSRWLSRRAFCIFPGVTILLFVRQNSRKVTWVIIHHVWKSKMMLDGPNCGRYSSRGPIPSTSTRATIRHRPIRYLNQRDLGHVFAPQFLLRPPTRGFGVVAVKLHKTAGYTPPPLLMTRCPHKSWLKTTILLAAHVPLAEIRRKFTVAVRSI
jgi:hypothetical protein